MAFFTDSQDLIQFVNCYLRFVSVKVDPILFKSIVYDESKLTLDMIIEDNSQNRSRKYS